MEIKLKNGILWSGDNLEYLRTLPDNSVSTIITDPPYGLEFQEGVEWHSRTGFSKPGIGKRNVEWPSYTHTSQYGGHNPTCGVCGGRARGAKRCSCTNPSWKDVRKRDGTVVAVNDLGKIQGVSQIEYLRDFHRKWLSQCFRVLKEDGILASFSSPRTVHHLAYAAEMSGFHIGGYLHYVYGTGFPKSHDVGKSTGDCRWHGFGTALKPCFEPVIVLTKNGTYPDFQSLFYSAKPSKKDRGNGNDHPTVKPVTVVEFLIKEFHGTGAILDPFMGSGTTALAAEALGFDWIGCEINPEYVEISKNRIADLRDCSLF